MSLPFLTLFFYSRIILGTGGILGGPNVANGQVYIGWWPIVTPTPFVKTGGIPGGPNATIGQVYIG